MSSDGCSLYAGTVSAFCRGLIVICDVSSIVVPWRGLRTKVANEIYMPRLKLLVMDTVSSCAEAGTLILPIPYHEGSRGV